MALLTECKRPWILAAFLVLVTTASAQLANTPTGQYWPLAEGNTWIYQNQQTGQQTEIQIVADPASPPAFPNTWGCSPQNGAIDAYITKSNAGTYWDPGTAENLHWMLGHDAMGNIMSWGQWTETEAEPHTPVNTTQLQSLTAGFPADLLLPVTVSENQDARLYQQYYFGVGDNATCLNNGSDGTFQAAKNFIGPPNPNAVAIAVGDFNGDGKPDLALISNGNIEIALGNGDGTFQAPNSYSTGFDAVTITVGDVNGDGILDLVAASDCTIANNCPTGAVVSVLLGNGDGTFQSPQTYSTGGYGTFSALVADVNGDGNLDLVVLNICQTASVSFPRASPASAPLCPYC
jgi:hypothetical protein